MNSELDDAWNRYVTHAKAEVDRASRRPKGHYPHYSDDGVWHLVDVGQLSGDRGGTYEHGNWTAGFTVGKLWLGVLAGVLPASEVVEAHLPNFTDRAGDYTTHDLGFLFYPTFVLPMACGNVDVAGYEDVPLSAAEMLAARFNERGAYIQAFGPIGAPAWAGTSTIDTMMNLPLLWWAASRPDARGYVASDVARRHARTSARAFIRPDGSTYHLVRFDRVTGAVLERGTFQGSGQDSTWSRGQAWAVAGMAWAHAAAGEQEFLHAADVCADYYWDHLPSDGVPPWDFVGGSADEAEDASASAIAALGALILSRFHPEPARRVLYSERAHELLIALARGPMHEQAGDSGILQRSSYSVPHGRGLSGATPWGDFYLGLALGLAAEKLPWSIVTGASTSRSGSA